MLHIWFLEINHSNHSRKCLRPYRICNKLWQLSINEITKTKLIYDSTIGQFFYVRDSTVHMILEIQNDESIQLYSSYQEVNMKLEEADANSRTEIVKNKSSSQRYSLLLEYLTHLCSSYRINFMITQLINDSPQNVTLLLKQTTTEADYYWSRLLLKQTITVADVIKEGKY